MKKSSKIVPLVSIFVKDPSKSPQNRATCIVPLREKKEEKIFQRSKKNKFQRSFFFPFFLQPASQPASQPVSRQPASLPVDIKDLSFIPSVLLSSFYLFLLSFILSFFFFFRPLEFIFFSTEEKKNGMIFFFLPLNKKVVQCGGVQCRARGSWRVQCLARDDIHNLEIGVLVFFSFFLFFLFPFFFSLSK